MLWPLYRKGKIFKSRAARATPPPPAPKPENSDVNAEPFAAFEEPPRVPPVSRHFVELGSSRSSEAPTAAAAANGKGVHEGLSALSPDKPDTKVGKRVAYTSAEPHEEQCKKKLWRDLTKVISIINQRSRDRNRTRGSAAGGELSSKEPFEQRINCYIWNIYI
jgi:hypothetical protein